MRTKKEINDLLNGDDFYSSVISGLPEGDRKKVQGIVEPMFVDAFSFLEEFVERVKQDPEAMQQLIKGLEEQASVINNVPPDKNSKEKLDGSQRKHLPDPA